MTIDRLFRSHPSLSAPRGGHRRDPGEDLRVRLHGAKIAIEAAANSDGLERVLNQRTAREHVLAALRLLQASQ